MFINATNTRFQNQEASIRNLENQVGQLAKLMAKRPQGSLPNNTEPNPKEQCKAIMLRSRRKVENEELKRKADKESKSDKVPPRKTLHCHC